MTGRASGRRRFRRVFGVMADHVFDLMPALLVLALAAGLPADSVLSGPSAAASLERPR